MVCHRFGRVLPSILIGSGILYGQSGTATLSGEVADSSGAYAPGVSVSATNTATGLKSGAITNNGGAFTIPLLQPGNYNVTAEHPGFAATEIKDVVLEVGDRVALQIKLTPGQVQESVTVTADAGQLQLKSESGERSQVITNKQVLDLALNGRNVLDLMKTLPGVVSNLNAQVYNEGGLDQFNINGTYPRTTLPGPGFVNHDVSVFKNIPLGKESVRRPQLRLEMFNAFNHTEFSGINRATQLVTPGGAIGSAIFSSYANVAITNNLRPAGSTAALGQFFGEFNIARDARIIQLGVKVYF